jgi:acetylglutamate kinase
MPGQKLYIIKIGGHIIDDERKLKSFLEAFASLDEKKILVHGGGKLATRMAEKLKIPQQVVDGRRITDAETLKLVTMVYAGYINKQIVALLQSFHCNALGLCGADGDAILAHKRVHAVMDYGFVGDVDAINTNLIGNLLNHNITLVFAPITHDQQGQLLNTNADTIAKSIAEAMGDNFETELLFTFEKPGVLMDINDESSVIKNLTKSEYEQLKKPTRGESRIFAGMIPKLDNAFAALERGVKKVVIGKAEDLRQLVSGRAGTSISNE